METLEQFKSRGDIKKLLDLPVAEILESKISRDPSRAIYYNKEVFYAPADGFVIYAREVKPDEEILSIKGGTYSVNTLLRDEIKHRCLVLGIMMTFIDVHINRLPTNGFVWYDKLPALKVTNLSMRPVEDFLLKQIGLDINTLQYGLFNERMVNKVFCPYLGQHYWLVQIADFEVDVIVPFEREGFFFTQGERFSQVRTGSQVDMIIPLMNKKSQFLPLLDDKEIWHVEAGVDAVVSIT